LLIVHAQSSRAAMETTSRIHSQVFSGEMTISKPVQFAINGPMQLRRVDLALLVVTVVILPSCVSSEIKGAVSAYAQAVEHDAISSKKLLSECIAPPSGLSDDDRKAECTAAAEGLDSITKSAQKLDSAVSGGSK
jgi:hypothetical protein